MEELLHRRYCRFVIRKKHKSKMNNDGNEGVNFKVRRFLQDVDKYNEKNKRKKKRKEGKKQEKNIFLPKNKGIYKNGVLSFPGIKELNCSSSARLKGDLIALTKKPNEENEHKICEDNILEEIENQRKTTVKVNEIPENKSDSVISTSKLAHVRELEVELDGNAVSRTDIIESSSEDCDHYRSDKENNLVQENNESHCCFSELNQNDVVETLVEEREDNCPENFDFLPHSKRKEIFDFFKTPEKKVISKFASFNKSPENMTPKWEAFNENHYAENFKTGSGCKTKSVMSLPNDYIFENNSENINIQNNSLLFSEIGNKDYKCFQTTKFSFVTNERNLDAVEPEINLVSSVNHLTPLKLFNSDTKLNKLFNEIPFDNSEKLNNSPPYFVPKRESALLNIAESHKKSISFADYYTKFDQKKTRWKTNMKTKLKKYSLEEKFQDQSLFKGNLNNKKELFNLKKPVLSCNQRFKNNLKFSPHKYC